MRLLPTFLWVAVLVLSAQSADEKDAVAAVQKIFDGMAAHDAAMIRSVMLPTAHLYSVRDDGAPAIRAAEDWVGQIASLKGDLVERFTGKPNVLVRGRIAQVWGEYEFLRDGKFTHCGVDTVSLFKTPEGWKVSALVFTMETKGCKGQ
jgi:hypothetical protein